MRLGSPPDFAIVLRHALVNVVPTLNSDGVGSETQRSKIRAVCAHTGIFFNVDHYLTK